MSMCQQQDDQAERERQREEKRREIKEKIRRLKEKIKALEEYKSLLEERYASTTDGVYVPGKEYDLTVSDAISHWKGKLEAEGEQKKEQTTGAVKKFLSGIDVVIEIIDRIISELWDEIEDLEDELASI